MYTIHITTKNIKNPGIMMTVQNIFYFNPMSVMWFCMDPFYYFDQLPFN